MIFTLLCNKIVVPISRLIRNVTIVFRSASLWSHTSATQFKPTYYYLTSFRSISILSFLVHLFPSSFRIRVYTHFFFLTDWNKYVNISKFHTELNISFTTTTFNSLVMLEGVCDTRPESTETMWPSNITLDKKIENFRSTNLSTWN